METTTLPPAPEPETATPFLDALAPFRAAFDRELAAFLAAKQRETAAAAPEAVVLVETLSDLATGGGKRLRPALVHHAYLACGGSEPAEVLPLALATELLHTYLLVHDDIMDHAEVRRGRPTAQVVFDRRHRDREWRGDAADYGRSMAILVGDLAASYAFELAGRGAPAADRAALAACFSTMAQEVIHGQYLEVLVSFLAEPAPADLERVLQLKSGRYSVERPLELGALAAGAGGETLAGLLRYGRALGEAFQLQDDLLGMFGDADTVGKPVGADLAEGKFTFLVYHALAGLAPAERSWLQSMRGCADLSREEAERARRLMVASGARERVREMIAERLDEARRQLANLPLEAPGRTFLEGLIDYSQERRR